MVSLGYVRLPSIRQQPTIVPPFHKPHTTPVRPIHLAIMCKKRESTITTPADSADLATGQAAVPVTMVIFVILTLAAWGFMWYQLRSQRMKKQPDPESGLANPRRVPDDSALTRQPSPGSSSQKWRRFLDQFKQPEPESGSGASVPESPVPLAPLAPVVPASDFRRSAPI